MACDLGRKNLVFLHVFRLTGDSSDTLKRLSWTQVKIPSRFYVIANGQEKTKNDRSVYYNDARYIHVNVTNQSLQSWQVKDKTG
jgi:hypothetical protein